VSDRALQSRSEVHVHSTMGRKTKVKRFVSSCDVRNMTDQESLVKSYLCGILWSFGPASNILSPRARHARVFFHSTT
jgi:hypothetical protein